MYKLILKPLFDFIAALFCLILVLPLLLIVSVLIKVDSKGPVFFKQKRLGYNGTVFTILKLRTMTNKKRISNREIFKDDPEVTKVGKILRRYKIDELPQIFNILIGNMSFIGPRAGLPEQYLDYNETARVRLKVKPGLTGKAQVNGNIYLSWEERWKLDKEYVETLSFINDLRILMKTFLVISLGEEKFLRND